MTTTTNIKLADVQSLLREWEASFDQSGIKEFEVKIAKDHCVASGWVNGTVVCRVAPSIGEALQKFREAVPLGHERARRLREDARALLRQAVELEASIGGPINE